MNTHLLETICMADDEDEAFVQALEQRRRRRTRSLLGTRTSGTGGELDVAMTPARKKAEQHRHSEDTGELQLDIRNIKGRWVFIQNKEERALSTRTSSMATHVQRKGCHQREPQGVAKMEGGKGGKERAAHHQDVCVLWEVGGGPGRPNFAGDRRGGRGPCRRFFATRNDSSCGDDPRGKAKTMGSLACRGRPPRYGAMTRWRKLCSGACTEEVLR
jgi:hypothetical protein